MPRRAPSLEHHRNEIKRRYKRGRRVERAVTSEQVLTDVERQVKREIACYLKAQDFSYNYIANTLNLSRDVVKKWFFELPEMRERVAEIQQDFADGAVRLAKSYAIEIIEIFMEIVRSTDDDKVAIQAGCELLDRIGLTKVTRSESIGATINRNEVDITDTTGLVDYLKDAPPELAQRAAQQMEDLLAMVKEGSQA